MDEADHMIVTEFDIDRYFKVAGKKLGDGLDYAYWIFKHNQGLDDKDAKIEVVVLAGHNDAMQRINDWCEDKFAELYNKYRAKIGKLNDACLLYTSLSPPFVRCLSDRISLSHLFAVLDLLCLCRQF